MFIDFYLKLKRKLLAFVRYTALLLSLLALSGCQSTPNNVIKLTLWQGVNPPPNRDVLQELVYKFNQEHSNIQVESLYVGQEDTQAPKILAAVVGNAPPDLLWFNSTITSRLADLKAIRPLEDLLALSPLREQIVPAMFETMQYQGHTWSVPFATNNTGVFYRPSLFKEAGITQLPTTWEEFRKVAKKLTLNDRYGMLLPLGKGEWTVFNWLPFMWSGGGELTKQSASPKDLDLVNEGAISALQLWRDLINDKSAILSAPERGYELDGFKAGKVAMQLTGPWTLGELQASGIDFGVFPIPSKVRKATITGGENIFIFKTHPQREEAAFKFAEYVLSEEFQTKWALDTGYLPINTQVKNDPCYQEFLEKLPATKVFLEQVQFGRSRPLFPGYSRISDNLGRAIESVLLGKRSPQVALEEAQRRLEVIFD